MSRRFTFFVVNSTPFVSMLNNETAIFIKTQYRRYMVNMVKKPSVFCNYVLLSTPPNSNVSFALSVDTQDSTRLLAIAFSPIPRIRRLFS